MRKYSAVTEVKIYEIYEFLRQKKMFIEIQFSIFGPNRRIIKIGIGIGICALF